MRREYGVGRGYEEGTREGCAVVRGCEVVELRFMRATLNVG